MHGLTHLFGYIEVTEKLQYSKSKNSQKIQLCVKKYKNFWRVAIFTLLDRILQNAFQNEVDEVGNIFSLKNIVQPLFHVESLNLKDCWRQQNEE